MGTKLAFVVHVIERSESRDEITGSRFVSTYRYRHGFYDPQEQEFRGFGYVEHTDTETYAPFQGAGLFQKGANALEDPLHVAPIITKAWFHTGAFLEGLGISARFQQEYYHGDSHAQAQLLPDTALPRGLTTAEQIEACRALKGQMLRQEIYAQGDSAESAHPYSVSERAYQVRRLQARAANPHAVFFTYPSEVVDYHYERNPNDPRIGHQINLKVDDFGNVVESVSVGYPRRSALFPEQAQTTILYTQNKVFNALSDASWHRAGVPVASRTFEVTLAAGPGPGLYGVDAIRQAIKNISTEIPYEALPASDTKRLIGRVRHLYYKDDLSGPLPPDEVGPLALPYESYTLASSPELVTAIFGNRVTTGMLMGKGRYVFQEGAWWSPSGRRVFSPAQFYLPVQFLDPFGNVAGVFYDNYSLLIERTESSQDPVLKNVTLVQNDHRTMSPALVTDPNGNRAAVRFDELGLVTATAVMGKDGQDEGDTLADPTTRFEYDLFQWKLHGKPALAHRLAREQHRDAKTRWLESYEYTDGFGRLIQKKVQAEPAPASLTLRWAGTGRVVFNNKGKPVKQYEPFFSKTPEYEDEPALVMSGVTPIIHYDPVGRVVRTDMPDGTFSRVEFDPWQQTTWDSNDAVHESLWYDERKNLPTSDPERRAADLAEKHAGTTSVVHLDSPGRPFLAIADNGPQGQYRTHTTLDIQGNPLVITDHLDRAVMSHTFDMLGRQLYQKSMDAGERWTFLDVAGKPVRSWDSRGHMMRTEYDLLGRQTHAFLQANGGQEILTDRIVYGEAHPLATALNLRGKPFEHYDGAGRVRNETFDFKGNAKTNSRWFAKDYKQTVDWSSLAALAEPAAMAAAAASSLEEETSTFQSAFDALNRVVSLITPDKSEARPRYNEGNLLDGVSVRLRGAAEATEFVNNIDYDAKGQRVLIAYGNGVHTNYTYDLLTFRLRRLETVRAAGFLQDLKYTFDPVGNITGIQDEAQQEIYFKNEVVSASAQYGYDAIYRLTFASGREHRGQGSLVVNDDDTPHMNQPNPNDGQAMRNYTETYEYDEVGNIAKVVRVADQQSWTQRHAYAVDSNRLLSTGVPDDPADGPLPTRYFYNAHGSMTAMPHLKQIDWNHHEQMSRVELGGGGTAYYVYDAAGQRARKVVERAGGLIQERFYLGPFEIYRERNNGKVALERETLHVMDDTRRIAIVETKTIDDGAVVASPKPIIRYQLGNHLGSASLELDDTGGILSYEEYYPYGSTSYQAGSSAAEVSLKRFRYTGKERDDETALSYHGARYYAPWLGRWTAFDPIQIAGGINGFTYVEGNPICFHDPHGTSREANAQERAFNATQRKVVLTPEQLKRAVNLPAPRRPHSVQQNRTRGLEAAKTWKRLFENKGHTDVREEIAPKGTKGGLVDLAPGKTDKSGEWNPTTRTTLESKSVDINSYRTDSGELDLNKLRTKFQKDFDQVRKHTEALQSTDKPNLPSREAIGYQLEGDVTNDELKTVRKLFNEEATTLPERIRGGVHRGAQLRAKALGAVGAVAPMVLGWLFEYSADRNYDEAAELRGKYRGAPTEDQEDRQRRAGWEFAGRLDELGRPVWNYQPGLLLRLRDGVLSLLNPSRPFGDPHAYPPNPNEA